MSFPVKTHLPLITPRVEYEFNTLPPPPTITPRRNLAAAIRRQARRDASPYGGPWRARGSTPFRTQPNVLELDSESSLSELSELEGSDNEVSGETGDKIPKPPGEAGRVNSGGYNLEHAMGWSAGRFAEFTAFVNEESADKLDIKKCYSKQNTEALEAVIERVADKFNIKNTYVKDWPIRDALKLRLKYTSEFEKKKAHRKVEKNLKNALNAPT